MRRAWLLTVLVAASVCLPRPGLGQSPPASEADRAAVAARVLGWADAIVATVDVPALKAAVSGSGDPAPLRPVAEKMALLAFAQLLGEVERASGRTGGTADAAAFAPLARAVVDTLDLKELRDRLAATADVDAARLEVRRMAVIVIAAVSGVLQQAYRQVQARARLAADQGLEAALRSGAAIYYARNDGKWPPTKEALKATVSIPVEFQCAGNDVDYVPATGEVRLLITDAARC